MNMCKEFDERQTMIRGKICKHIMIMMAFTILLNGFLKEMGAIIWNSYISEATLTMIIPVTIGSVEMSIKGVYLNDKMKKLVILFGLIAGAQIFYLVWSIKREGVGSMAITNGLISENLSYGLLTICFVTIFVSILIRQIYDRQMDKKEIEEI